jgi:hypothetical protein
LPMGEVRCAEYIDFLSQMGVVESIAGDDGEVWLTLKIPVGQMLKKVIEEGVSPPVTKARDLLSWASCALASKILDERGSLYSREDLLCVASILRAFISAGIESEPELYPALAREELRLPARGPKRKVSDW